MKSNFRTFTDFIFTEGGNILQIDISLRSGGWGGGQRDSDTLRDGEMKKHFSISTSYFSDSTLDNVVSDLS